MGHRMMRVAFLLGLCLLPLGANAASIGNPCTQQNGTSAPNYTCVGGYKDNSGNTIQDSIATPHPTADSTTQTNTGNTAASAATVASAIATPGSDATKASAVQGCTGCKPVATASSAWKFIINPSASSTYGANSCIGIQGTFTVSTSISSIEVKDIVTSGSLPGVLSGQTIALYIFSAVPSSNPCPSDGATFPTSFSLADTELMVPGLDGLSFNLAAGNLPTQAWYWRQNTSIWLSGGGSQTFYYDILCQSCTSNTLVSGEKILVLGNGPQ
jgi:hypothetical protein